MFTRDLFHQVRRLPIFVLVGGGRHFRLGQSFVAQFTSREAGASPKRDGTQNPQFRFQGRRWFIHTSSCTEKQLVLRSVYQSNASVAFCFVVGFVYIGQFTGTAWRQRLPVRRAFPDTSVFKDAQDVVRGIASVLPSKKLFCSHRSSVHYPDVAPAVRSCHSAVAFGF